MPKNFVNKNLLTKAFLILLCAVFCISCQPDQTTVKSDAKAKDEAALQNDAKAKAEINRVNQILSSGRKISQEDFDSVRKIYDQYPSSETIRKTIRSSLIQREDWASLEKFFNEIPASELSQEDKLSLAKVYIKLGRFEDSVEVLKTLEDKNDLEMKSLLANANFHLGNYDEAKNLLDGSWEQIIKEKRVDDIYVRGMIYFYAKENEKAIETFEKLLEIAPDNAPAANGLSRVYASQGETEKAEEYLAKVQQIFDKVTAEEKRKANLVENLYKLQEAYKANRFQEVVALANQILPEADERNKAILYQYLFNSYKALGKQKEAQEVLSKARQMQQK